MLASQPPKVWGGRRGDELNEDDHGLGQQSRRLGYDDDGQTLGAWLTVDPKLERFIGNGSADAMLAREYRKPYDVPAEI